MNETAESKPDPLWRRVWNRPGVRGMSLMFFRLLVFIALAAGLGFAMRYLIPLPRLTPAQSLSVSGWELWFCMGLHAAWNFTQGPLLGIPVSGFDVQGLLISRTQGNELISGGQFGAEASILTLIVCVALGLFFAKKAIATGNILKPSWRRPLQ